MATSTIRIYRTVLTPARNALVDDLDTYLNGTTLVYEDTSFQYQKLGLDINVKININQDVISNHNLGNYVVIAQDGKKWYYFIMNTEWKGTNTVNLRLSLDTINTFRNDLTFTEKTTIQRQHKDRFVTYPALSNEILSYLDDAEWDWGTGAGEIIGTAQFRLPDEFIGRNFTSTINLVQGQGADVYNVEYDKDLAVVYITAYVQGESSPIPQGRIKITTTSAKVTSNQLIRKIDEQSEGFETTLWGKDEEVLTQQMPFIYGTNATDVDYKDFGKNTWYLTYKTETGYQSNDPDKFIYNNPVRCYLTTDLYNYHTLKKTGVTVPMSALNSLAAHGRILSITLPINANGRVLKNSFDLDYPDVTNKDQQRIIYDIIGLNDQVIGTGEIVIDPLNDRRANGRGLVLAYNADYIPARLQLIDINIKRDNYLGSYNTEWDSAIVKEIRFKNVSQVKVYVGSTEGTVWTASVNFYKVQVTNYISTSVFSTSSETILKTFNSFNDADRTDPKLIKIINVPYCPVNIENSNLLFDDVSNQLTLSIQNIGTAENPQWKGQFDPSFNNNIVLNINQNNNIREAYSPLSPMLVPVNPNVAANRNDLYESKLYHSDFYQCKFIYDSFDYTFRLELLNTTNIDNNSYKNIKNLNTDYSVSNTVGSAFGFKFNSYFPLKKEFQNYNVLLVNRNNEMAIYNNNYLNYIRNGYNYDVKNKQTREITTGIGTGLGIAQTVAGIALAASGYGSGLGAGLIVSGIATTAGSLTSAISGAVQADRTMQQKLEQAKNQAASVQGSDDIGLLKWYANNNLCKLMKYELSDYTKQKIADLFYYCGYKCDYQELPNTNSRYWFNFIQCKPIFKEEATSPYNDYIDDIKARYEAGVTVYHHHTTWDFDQVKENWENSLIN